jgi:hypothetical protein
MATTAEIDAAVATLRTLRTQIVDLTQQRVLASQRRDKAVAEVGLLNTAITNAKADMATAKTTLATLLGQTET